MHHLPRVLSFLLQYVISLLKKKVVVVVYTYEWVLNFITFVIFFSFYDSTILFILL